MRDIAKLCECVMGARAQSRERDGVKGVLD